MPVTWLLPGKTHRSWPALKSGDAISRAVASLTPSRRHGERRRRLIVAAPNTVGKPYRNDASACHIFRGKSRITSLHLLYSNPCCVCDRR